LRRWVAMRSALSFRVMGGRSARAVIGVRSPLGTGRLTAFHHVPR
jgi:hypothetical protein